MKLILITLLLTGGMVFAAESTVLPAEAQQTVTTFLKRVAARENQPAIGDLLAHKGKWRNKEAEQQLLSTLDMLSVENIGEAQTMEITHLREIGKHYHVITAMITYERQPVFFRFTFYRPAGKLVTDTLLINTNFSESAKEEYFAGERISGEVLKLASTPTKF